MRGVKLVISDAHEGLKAAANRVLGATSQRCRVHFQRNAMAHAGKTQRRIVAAWIGPAFAEPTRRRRTGSGARSPTAVRPSYGRT